MSKTCSLCGVIVTYPIYEIINLVRGGEVVGYLCGGCGRKCQSSEEMEVQS